MRSARPAFPQARSCRRPSRCSRSSSTQRRHRPMLIDSHCHLDFPELAAGRAGVLARARAAGIDGMVTISTRVKHFDEIKAIAEEHAEVWCSVGTHPHHADEELDIFTEDLVR